MGERRVVGEAEGVKRRGSGRSQSLLLIHKREGVSQISRGKVEQFGWLVQADVGSQDFYHLA